MIYYIKSGILYLQEAPDTLLRLAAIKAPAYTAQKCISTKGDDYFTDITSIDAGRVQSGRNYSFPGLEHHLSGREYTLSDHQQHILASAVPVYNQEYGSPAHSRPLSYAPRISRAAVDIGGSPFCLTMLNSQNYRLTDPAGHNTIEILHNGLGGGWNVTACPETDFPPIILLGLFIFCRYLEKENEFVVV